MKETTKAIEPSSLVGGLLRKRREQLGLDISDISAQLRIRGQHLKAIEAGQMHELPGLTYTMGFVRAYADYLGLEGKLIVADFREEMSQRSNVRPLEFPRHQTQGRLPGLVPIAISLILGLILYAGWFYWNNRNFQTGSLSAVEPVPADLAAAPNETAAPGIVENINPSPPSNPLPFGNDPSAEATSTTPPANAASPVTPLATDPISAAPEGSTPGTTETSAPKDIKPAAPSETGNTTAASGEANIPLRLHAKLDSWVDIRDENNQVIMSRVLRQGEDYDPPSIKGLTLTTGNAGGLEILVNGAPLPSLGGIGIVVRGIALDIEKLNAGLPANTTTGAAPPNANSTQEPAD